MEENFWDEGPDEEFLDMRPKSWPQKISKLDFIEIITIVVVVVIVITFISVKNLVKRMKRQTRDWKKIFINHISDKGLILEWIYKELPKLNIKLKNQTI